MARELAVEFRKQRDAVGEAKLGAGGGERGIFRRRGGVDDEARAGKRLEQGGERGSADPVVRPRDACAQGERGLGVEQQQPVEAPAQLASGVGRVVRIKAEREAASVEVGWPTRLREQPGLINSGLWIAMTIVENVRLSRHAGRVRRDVRSWR